MSQSRVLTVDSSDCKQKEVTGQLLLLRFDPLIILIPNNYDQ